MLVLKNKLLIAIVNRGHAERFFAIARKAGASGGTIIPAKGTATNSILAALGLGDTSKEIVLILLDEQLALNIMNAVHKEDKIQGVVALLGEEENNMDNKWKMITVIVNTGYADDIMDAARKAGATGGTVTHARGTGTAEDAHFLGVTIVPEKEMIMILAESDKSQAIVEAISSLKCLEEPGIGIIYTQDVKEFKNLSPKK
jgi:nitrogen regulatory protein PII